MYPQKQHQQRPKVITKCFLLPSKTWKPNCPFCRNIISLKNLVIYHYYQQRSYSINTYIRPSVRFRRKRDFLGPYIEQSSHFFCDIPLVYEHLFYKYFVRWSIGQATKGKRASVLMDVVILVESYNYSIYSTFHLSISILLRTTRTTMYKRRAAV